MTKNDVSCVEFVSLSRELLQSTEFGRMKGYRHHIKSTLYEHSVKVAYLCYKYYKRHPRMGKQISSKELVQAALLHDYYLYDLHGSDKRYRFHWFRHPRIALKNAVMRYPSLTATQRDAIRNHMFPLTWSPPRTRVGWLVCFYDKVAAIHDRFGKKNRKKAFYNLLETKRKQNLKTDIVK